VFTGSPLNGFWRAAERNAVAADGPEPEKFKILSGCWAKIVAGEGRFIRGVEHAAAPQKRAEDINRGMNHQTKDAATGQITGSRS
jgi:hypothetical protein